MKGPKAYSGVDPKAHLSDGAKGSKSGYDSASPNKAYSGVDPKGAAYGSGKAGKAKPGGNKINSRVISGSRGEGPGY